ncbi:hypothetical protein ACP4OV_010994 [Aristida adscensionis]
MFFHSRRVTMLLPLLVLLAAAVTASPGVASAEDSASGHHPPLLDCTPAPARPAGDDAAFRANVASALAALPSAAAAAPTGFAATTRSRGAGGLGRAFARGLCFDGARSDDDSSAGDDGCLACLSAAARDIAAGCGGADIRRSGVWRAGCFVAYADTDTPSAREDAFRGWFYADGPDTSAATADGECAGNRTTASCSRCLEESARTAAALGWLPRIGGQEVVVVGYGCSLRVRISVLPWGPGHTSYRGLFLGLWLKGIVAVAASIVGLAFFLIIDTLRVIPRAVSVGEFLGFSLR